MRTDWLIVGAGFTGCTLAERIASQLGQAVVLVDRRSNVGGNAYDFYNDEGVLVHQYGPHIFHTNSTRVWEYLSRFTAWRPYSHRVLAVVEGKKIAVPFNLNSLAAVMPERYAAKLENLLLEKFGIGAKVPILKLREVIHDDLRFLADYIYDNVFYGYTVKQWECRPEELDPSVTGRVPVHISRDNRYFQDTYQAMPRLGYSELFRRQLDHPNIQVLLDTDYRRILSDVKFSRMIFTGPINTFFDDLHGPLPYRSIRFEFSTLDVEQYQEAGTVNYPNDYEFTRVTEQKYLSGQTMPKTTLVKEFPQRHVEGETEPYYPIPRPENRETHSRYLQEAEKLNGSVLFAGRLADYKCYNMDQAVGRALRVFEEVATGSSAERRLRYATASR
ncbi:MAG TPA: UDP-galactopyranose mutase [Bryobacteraceae bacterium]|nr:UDP-galactopyranose mutase [Bryobacteraceae bacterium]